MRKALVIMAALALAATAAAVGTDPFGATGAQSAWQPRTEPTEQSDSVRFVLNGDPQQYPQLGDGDNVYCGVAVRSEPYVLDVAVVSPPVVDQATGENSPSHDGSGWLGLVLQGRSPLDTGTAGERGIEFRVPRNDSFSFDLTLGGIPNVDQLVLLKTEDLGDPDGSGAAFAGFATVRARPGAVDPFNGDGRSDNYCVSIGNTCGLPGGEFAEGAISTTLPVRDDWVVDGEGSDGGVLRARPS